MVYLFALVGLALGFFAGLQLIKHLLSERTRNELLLDKSLWRRYGSLCWLIAFAGMGLGILLFKIVVP